MFPTACSFVPFFWLFYVILTSDVADVRVENGELFIVWRKKKSIPYLQRKTSFAE